MWRKSTIIVIVVLILLMSYGGYLIWKKKDGGQNIFNRQIPSLTDLGKTNLPGKLFGPRQGERAADLSATKIIEITNTHRADAGLKSLTLNQNLTGAAQTKVQDMFQKQYFEHVSPTGIKPADLVLAAGYQYKTTGENLALGDFKDEKDLVDAWMASPGHRANILNAEYTEIGVASGLDKFESRDTWLSVQEFGKPAPNCAAPSNSMAARIDNKKTEYAETVSKIENLNQAAQTLYAQANTKIEAGNEIYKRTKDKSQAQPYWDEGEALRAQADTKTAEAKALEANLGPLYDEINLLVNEYNNEVNRYNACIAK